MKLLAYICIKRGKIVISNKKDYVKKNGGNLCQNESRNNEKKNSDRILHHEVDDVLKEGKLQGNKIPAIQY